MNFKDELMNDIRPDIHELLDNTNPKKIYLTSDWHFFKNHYKHEANYVNTQKILTWCRQNIKDDDVFMYLGDISFRYANDEDKKKSAEFMKSIPGIKVLLIGNHDVMAGYDYYTSCGFDYVFMRLDWHNIVFTHKPISMELMPEDYLNIHGHIHNIKTYNTCDGKKNINVYPLWYNGLPTTLDYVLKHKEKLTKDNSRSNWTNIGEASLDVLEDYDNIVKSINESNNKTYNKISIEDTISKYKEKYPRLKHIRVSKNTKGYGLVDNNNLIGIINVETKSNGEKWIQALEVFEPYKQQGYSTILLDIAINDLNATLLSVSKNNTLAKQIYDRYGFNTIKDDNSMYYMSINENSISKNIYHLSDNNFNGKTLNPRVPSNYFTKNGYEDGKTARVCFSTSIEGCLRAESENITDKEFFVHIPDGAYKIYNPTIKEVPDVKLTNEVWIKEPVKLKCIGKIKVIDSIDKPLPYKYGNNIANLYDWKYTWIEKINESSIINKKDIYYNKNKFDSGEINLCFVTGLSGSGKSTLGTNMDIKMDNNGILSQYCELDQLLFIKDNFTLIDLKNYGDLLYTFFTTIGNKYYIGYNDLNDFLKENNGNYENILYKDFIHYAMEYANSHKETKFILEGLWMFATDKDSNKYWFDPSEFKNYAFYIKGTSMIISKYRAAKRDAKYNNLKFSKRFFIDSWKYYILSERNLNKFRKYFKSLMKNNINESNRSDLPDSEFGIPEDRKYPLDTKKHVNSAIRLFGHAEEDKKEMLAKRIKSAADKYDLSIAKNTQVYKYLNEATNNDFIIPEEVKNIVFDMGGVLIGDSTLEAIKSHPNIPDKYAKTIYDLIIEKMFYRKDNANLTTASVEKAKEYFYNILPEEIKPYINDIFETYSNGLYLYNFVDKLLNLFKSYGYKIYYLSNWDRWTLDLEKEFFEPLLSKFDGGIFSAECNMEKPSISIYKHFLNKFNLVANECLFFDDKKENVDAAILCGMHSIIFNDKETPLKIFKSFNSTKHKLLDNPNEFIPIIKNNELSYININRIKYWYGSDIKLSIILNRDLCVPSLYQIINRDVTPDKIAHIYVPDKDSKSVYIGSIIGLGNSGWKWITQYPLYINSNNEIISKPINENALNAMNPIIGTVTKPYVLKMMNDNSIMSNKAYAFSPDLISDKYLVINENGYLEVVDSSILDNMVVEEYEFIGDMEKLNKINEAYKNNKIVDNTFFYTALTGKPLLTEDQIDFDPLFKKVNFYAIKEKYLSEMATLHDKYLEASNQSLYNIDTLLKNNEFTIRNDINGKYIYNENTNRRSDSINRNESFTKEMYESTKW